MSPRTALTRLDGSRTGRSERCRRRATALIATIAVLAVLTLLVMGLAASFSASRQNKRQTDSRSDARAMARLALECAAADLRHNAEEAAGRSGQIRRLTDGAFSYAFRPAAPADPVYDGRFLNPRPGDVFIETRGWSVRKAAPLSVTQVYLVNLDPAHHRCIMLREAVDASTSGLEAGPGNTPPPSDGTAPVPSP